MQKERGIQINLRRVAFEHGSNVSKISRKTGISRTTLTALYHQRSQYVSFDVLEKLCRYFNCGVGELIEFKGSPSE